MTDTKNKESNDNRDFSQCVNKHILTPDLVTKSLSLPDNRVYTKWHRDQWVTGPGKYGYKEVGAV